MEAARLAKISLFYFLHLYQIIFEKHPQRGSLEFSYPNKSVVFRKNFLTARGTSEQLKMGTTHPVRPLCHLLIFNIGPTPAVRAQGQLQRVTNYTKIFEKIENFLMYRSYHFLFKYTENEIKVRSDSKPRIETNLNCHS